MQTSPAGGCPKRAASCAAALWLSAVASGCSPLFQAPAGPTLARTSRSALAAPTGPLATPRKWGNLHLLPTGKAIIVGGHNGSTELASTEVYDLATGTWTLGPSFVEPLAHFVSVMLPSGKLLVTKGHLTQLYDPQANTFSPAATGAGFRNKAVGVLLKSGKVILIGGNEAEPGAAVTRVELYDPTTDTWSLGAPLPDARRSWHTATLLRSGKVFVVGGNGATGSDAQINATTLLYDPVADSWAYGPSLPQPRRGHTATLLTDGKVLIVGGYQGGDVYPTGALLYDPDTNGLTGAGTSDTDTYMSAILLPSGAVAFFGGPNIQTYDPVGGTFAWTGTLSPGRDFPPATLLPDGRVLVAGGESGATAFATAELYDPRVPSWSATGSSAVVRSGGQESGVLPDGRVLIVDALRGADVGSEVYDPSTGTWGGTGAMAQPRFRTHPVLLPSGRLFVAAGASPGPTPIASAELYDHVSGTWSPGPSRPSGWWFLSSTLLPDGRVLQAGGTNGAGWTTEAFLYDPVGASLSPAAPLATARDEQYAVLLRTGKVLVVGGNGPGAAATAELYDPAADSWSSAGSLVTPRHDHVGALLPDGRVLIVGGVDGTATVLASAELYDPALNSWSSAPAMSVPRTNARASLLPSGRVLVSGGEGAGGIPHATTEVFDPATGAWSASASLLVERTDHIATVLANGRVLISHGTDSGAGQTTAELFDEGLQAEPAWTPSASFPPSVSAGSTVTLAGSGLRGVSDATGSNGFASPTDFPLVHLRRDNGGATYFVPTFDWTETSTQATVPYEVVPGVYWARVIVNGVASDAVPLVVTAGGPHLAFTSPPQQLVAGTTSSPLSIQRRDGTGVPVLDGNLTVNLTTTSSGGAFTQTPDDALSWSAGLALALGPGESTASFFYRDTQPGGPTLTASAAGHASTSQQQSVRAPTEFRYGVGCGCSGPGASTQLPWVGALALWIFLRGNRRKSVDGVLRGASPLALELPAGPHSVIAVHPATGVRRALKVELAPGQRRELDFDL